jgi:Fe-S oxidoreductase
LDLHDEEAKLVSQQTYDICEFLPDMADAGQLKTDSAGGGYLPYHSPCQLKAHTWACRLLI